MERLLYQNDVQQSSMRLMLKGTSACPSCFIDFTSNQSISSSSSSPTTATSLTSFASRRLHSQYCPRKTRSALSTGSEIAADSPLVKVMASNGAPRPQRQRYYAALRAAEEAARQQAAAAAAAEAEQANGAASANATRRATPRVYPEPYVYDPPSFTSRIAKLFKKKKKAATTTAEEPNDCAGLSCFEKLGDAMRKWRKPSK
ncbi:hypothetical protein VTO42DRAFT_5836 [Malbranchea cinnamomea]